METAIFSGYDGQLLAKEINNYFAAKKVSITSVTFHWAVTATPITAAGKETVIYKYHVFAVHPVPRTFGGN